MAFRSRGLPSNGCNHCRSRKVRCDELKPTCDRCKKARHSDCKYRDVFQRTWRWQNSESMNTVPAGAREILRSRPNSINSSMISNVPLGDEVLGTFFYDWSIVKSSAPGISISWFNSLPTTYTQARTNSLVYYSISALANASYGRKLQNRELLAEAATWCGKAIRMLRSELYSSSSTLFTREILISTVLLGIYETLVDPGMASNGSWMSHMFGAAVLLKMRSGTSPTPADLEISITIVRQMLHGCLISGQAPSMSKAQVMQIFPAKLKHVSSLTELVFNTATLFSVWRSAFHAVDTPSGLHQLCEIANCGINLSGDFDRWVEKLPSAFEYDKKPFPTNPQLQSLRTLLDGDWAPECAHQYSSPVAQMVWRCYWVTRLILCQVLLYTHKTLEKTPSVSTPLITIQKDIECCFLSLIDRLCESCLAPFVTPNLSNFNSRDQIPSLQGYLLLQILPALKLCVDQVVISNVDLTSRKEWISKMGAFLKGHFGFAKAATVIEPSRYAQLPIQLWGLSQ